GFTQNGPIFQAKIKGFAQDLHERVLADFAQTYPAGVEFYTPTAPTKLVVGGQPTAPIDMRAWKSDLDAHSRLEELEMNFDFFSDYIREHGPFDGIVGFSQGAGFAMMLAAWCSGDEDRLSNLAAQGHPIRMPAPQGPFQWAVLASAACMAHDLYWGFYEPKIKTPSLHIHADLDTITDRGMSQQLVDACVDAEEACHGGTHYWPKDAQTTTTMLDFV
ncbi:hypothetical protein BAUCODRAFT_49812, partial [Baudoinia panamericana UAMH 10762]